MSYTAYFNVGTHRHILHSDSDYMLCVVESQLSTDVAFVQNAQNGNVEKVTKDYKMVTNCNFYLKK